MFADPVWNASAPEAEQALVARLTETFSPAQLAVAYLQVHRTQRSAPEELSEVDAKPAPRAEFGASVWFSITGGRKADAEPRRLLPLLCRAGDLTKDHIGAIRVQYDHSYVQILDSKVAGFLAAIGPDGVLEAGAVAKQLSEPPELGGTQRPAPNKRPGGGAKRPKFNPDRSDTPPAPYKKNRTEVPVGRRGEDDVAKPRKRDPETHRQVGPKPGKKPRSADGPKGPPPPKSKPNSKKNKARALAAAKDKAAKKSPKRKKF